VLLVAREELVARLQVERVQYRVDAVRGRPGDRNIGLGRAEQAGRALAQRVDPLDLAGEPEPAAPALLELLAKRRLGGVERSPRHRPVRAGVEVGDLLEDGKLGSELLHGVLG